MKTIQKSAFKPRAFEYFRLVEQGESLIITDHGRPVAKIIPYTEGSNDAIGILRGVVKRYDGPTEPVASDEWEAEA